MDHDGKVGPKWSKKISMENDIYLTRNHRKVNRSQKKMKNQNFQNFIVVTFYKNVNNF